jgi:signal transduction histidine kinase
VVQGQDNLTQLSALVGGFAHEIRNPLSTIGLNLQLLAREFAETTDARGERVGRRIELVRQEVERLQRVLDEFLRIARPVALKREPGDLNRVLRQMVDFVEPELRRRGIELRLYCDESLPLVPMDSARLRQAILNLLLNAQNALEEKVGGTREIILSARPVGDRVRLTVLDNGPGMRPETVRRCWQAWYSTRPGGSGLGLPLARQIVLDHGGTIGVESEVGRGTQFIIELPLDRPKE